MIKCEHNMKLHLSRASAEDFDQLVPLAFRAFKGDALTPAYFGPLEPLQAWYAKKTFLAELGEDSAAIWVKVEDWDAGDIDVDVIGKGGAATGKKREKRIVAAANWRIVPTYVPPKEESDEAIPLSEFEYQPTQQEQVDAQTCISGYINSRAKDVREPHVLCNLIFIDPEYQGKKIGSMMMNWGHGIADKLMIPTWLESSIAGKKFYPKFGYVLTKEMSWETKSWGTVVSCRMRRGFRGGENGFLINGEKTVK
jgi:GNAT superfamily N-acetyltransferase